MSVEFGSTVQSAAKRGSPDSHVLPRLLREARQEASSSGCGQLIGDALPIGMPPAESRPSTYAVSHAPKSETPGFRTERGRGEPERAVTREKLEPPIPAPAEPLHGSTFPAPGIQTAPAIPASSAVPVESTQLSSDAAALGENLSGSELPHEDHSPTEELPYSASARLGVLRKLFFAPEFPISSGDDQSEFRTEREAGHSSYARGTSPPAADDHGYGSPSPVSVTAHPEILKPKSAPPPMVKEKEPLRTVPTPPRRDSADDIETLPSWRGQYRKRRFPSS